MTNYSGNGPVKCQACGKALNRFNRQRHHKFPNTKRHRDLYGAGNAFDGRDWINHPGNIMITCDCNVSHQGPGLIIWNEFDFCRNFKLRPRSKTAELKIMQGKIERWWEYEEI